MSNEKIMDRVSRLLALAEHPNTPPAEAETALRMANSLITKHAIDEAILRRSQTISDRRSIKRSRVYLGAGEFTPYLRTIFESAADSLRVSVGQKMVLVDGKYTTEFWAYGADEDVTWLEMLFSMVKLQLLMKIDPKWDSGIGYDANIYNFKVAGFKWKEINRIAMENGHESRESTERTIISRRRAEQLGLEHTEVVEGETKHDWDGVYVRQTNGFFHKLKAAYVRHSKAIGDDTRVVTQSHEAYRLSFAESFRSTMSERFFRMKMDSEEEMDSIPGAALAIRDMREESNEALWRDFPYLNPEEIERRNKEWRDRQEEEARLRESMLASMTTKERQEFLEKEESDARKKAKNDASWVKKNTRYLSRDISATERGAKAANEVDLTRKAGSASRGEDRLRLE